MRKISRPSVTYWSDAWRRFRRNKVAMVSAIVLILIAVLAIVVPMVSSYTYDKTDLMAVNQGPSGEHLFGTDDLGRDIFVRCWEGARVSLFYCSCCIDLKWNDWDFIWWHCRVFWRSGR